MKIISLGSSSKGNCYVISDGANLIMLECGFSYSYIAGELQKRGYIPAQLSGVLISHEHDDHARSWHRMVMHCRVYASGGTIDAFAEKKPSLAAMVTDISPETPEDYMSPVYTVGGFDVISFRTFHNTKEPLGFLIRSRLTGEQLVFAIDTANLNYRFSGVEQMMLEANYAEGLLEQQTHLLPELKKRIRHCHMEIGRLCDYLRGLDLSDCREIYLMHLSDKSSDEYLFYRKVRAVVPEGVKVYILPRGGPGKERKKRC